MLPLSFVTAAVILAVWFPLTTLWHQQGVIDATSAQIASINRQSQDLKDQARSVSSKAAEEMLARSQYQLVSPGQSLIQVLPGDGSGYVSQSTGDPGLQPLVAPLSATTASAAPSTARHVTHSSLGKFFVRFVRTLEFWR
ncbi:MAG: hypothetical protein WAN30_05850 [Acidimicrobiales bacterium]